MDRWRDAATTILNHWDVLVDSLQGDPEADKWRAYLDFDRKQVTAGVRAVLEIVLAKAERETRIVIEKSLSEAATFSRIVLEQSQRLENLRAAAESAGGPFPGVKIKLSPEVKKALTILTQGRL
jgi:hypothetical protein